MRPDDETLRRLSPSEKVVRAFFRDDRLVAIPAKPSKRDLLMPLILDRCFPEDRPYEEKEVNMRLALLHPDVAALRRELAVLEDSGGRVAVIGKEADAARMAYLTVFPQEG